MKFVAGNAQHIGARPEQQDAFGFSDPSDGNFVAHAGFLGVVADGMGGLAHGTEASRSAVSAFLEIYKRKRSTESISDALTRCLHEANMAVLQVAESVGSGEEVGTTLVAAVLHHYAIHWVSVGDSRIYLLRGNSLTQLTADHVFGRELNRQVAEGRISLADAQSHPERAALTSYLGQRELAHIDRNVRPLMVGSDDRVMLCSDGFYRALTEKEMIEGFGVGTPAACEALLGQALAKHRKQQDNLTVIAFGRQAQSGMHPILKMSVIAILLSILGGAGYWSWSYYQVPAMQISIYAPKPLPDLPAIVKKTPTASAPKPAVAQVPPKTIKNATGAEDGERQSAGASGGKGVIATPQHPKPAKEDPKTKKGKVTQKQPASVQDKSKLPVTGTQDKPEETSPPPGQVAQPPASTAPAAPAPSAQHDQPAPPEPQGNKDRSQTLGLPVAKGLRDVRVQVLQMQG